MEQHKTTAEEAILIAMVTALSTKIDYANLEDFLESKTFEEYENRRGVIDINEEEFNFLKNSKYRSE